jgi:polysaccharide export outer membrane protein
VKSVLSLDSGLLRDRLDERSGERTHLKDVLDLVDFELQVLAKQAEHQEKERALQQAEVANARSLVNKGLIPLPRLQELERQESRLSRDLLENQAFAARASQTKATMKHDLEAADTKWRIEVRRDLLDAMLDRRRLESEIEILTDRLRAAGLSLNEDDILPRLVPQVVIHRSVAGHDEILNATMATEIRPGDVLDVDLTDAPS